ncbi:MAG: hypothetical protein WCG83_03960 [Candidatus Peregrinibacteria bacterium]
MAVLPISIETYLVDAGFSATELLIIKNLLEGEAMTLRELGSKTGKSTGVLDQAVKKLMSRRIITKEIVNAAPKVTLASLDAVLRWMQEDMKRTIDAMQSRTRDFESFVATVRRESNRPEIEFFEGKEGLMKAYEKLLTADAREFLHYLPVTCREEDDPLRDFRVQYFRDRRRRGIFSRILAENTSEGRRFRSRDAFEYRKTILLPEGDLPFAFEKLITPSAIACFHHTSDRACIIRYPELATTEHDIFETLWKSALRADNAPPIADEIDPEHPVIPKIPVPLHTRILSSLREFFVSRKSLAAFGLFAVASVVVTYALYRQNYNLNLQRTRERAMSIAITGAMQFDARDLDQLRTAEDMKKPEYRKILDQLLLIKSKNENIKYVYIHRPTGLVSPSWEVVASAELDSKDLNGDGKIEESEQLIIPGQKYPHEDPNIEEVLKQPSVFYVEDEWGKYFDASAPIYDSEAKLVAVFYVDIDVQETSNLTRQSFNYLLCFFGIFLLLAFIRFAALNRSLILEIFNLLHSRGIFVFLGISAVVALAVTYGIYWSTYNLNLQRTRERAMSIVATGAMQFDTKDLDQLHTIEDIKKPEYAKVVKKLDEIRSMNEGVSYAYILRQSHEKTGYWEYVADADSLDPYAKVDSNYDGIVDDQDMLQYPGLLYDVFDPYLDVIMQETYSNPEINSDEFGTYTSLT